MRIKDIWKSSKLRQFWRGLSAHKIFVRFRRLSKSDNWSMKYLLPGRLWLDTVDVVITTKCNLLCKGCHHLMPYYQQPYHMDKERLIAAMKKLNECLDWCDHYNFLGGEPFLNPDLKYYIAEAPDEKCNIIQLTTNATIIPTDPELFEVMRRKKVRILLSQYPSNRETQQRLISILQQEGIEYRIHTPVWTEYGEPIERSRSAKELKQQFSRCPVKCKQLYDGALYYCFRSSNCHDLGICNVADDEYVDLINNTKEKNRREIRRLMWRRKPVEACKYCLRGTKENVKIPRGE